MMGLSAAGNHRPPPPPPPRVFRTFECTGRSLKSATATTTDTRSRASLLSCAHSPAFIGIICSKIRSSRLIRRDGNIGTIIAGRAKTAARLVIAFINPSYILSTRYSQLAAKCRYARTQSHVSLLCLISGENESFPTDTYIGATIHHLSPPRH